MCNLGEGLVERTAARVTAKVTAEVTAAVTKKKTEQFVLNMFKDGLALDQIVRISELKLDEVKTIIEKNKGLTA